MGTEEGKGFDLVKILPRHCALRDEQNKSIRIKETERDPAAIYNTL